MSPSTRAVDIKAIEAVAQTYLDGLYEGDTDKIAKAFHAVSHLYSVDAEGRVADLPRADWFAAMAQRPSAKSRGLTRTDRIVSIDIAGPEMAFVKLECSIHPRYFTDYLTFLKLQEGWRVVSKSFRTDVRE
jgi:Putative lumazine-binding